jgi:hypothetical protein
VRYPPWCRGGGVALQEVVVGGHVGGRLALGALKAGRLDVPGQGGDDLLGDIVLHREHVVEFAVVTLGPQVMSGGGIDQLRGDAHAVAGLTHAAL